MASKPVWLIGEFTDSDGDSLPWVGRTRGDLADRIVSCCRSLSGDWGEQLFAAQNSQFPCRWAVDHGWRSHFSDHPSSTYARRHNAVEIWLRVDAIG